MHLKAKQIVEYADINQSQLFVNLQHESLNGFKFCGRQCFALSARRLKSETHVQEQPLCAKNQCDSGSTNKIFSTKWLLLKLDLFSRAGQPDTFITSPSSQFLTYQVRVMVIDKYIYTQVSLSSSVGWAQITM